MVMTIIQCYWMMSTVLVTTTSLSYSVLSLHTLIVDVLIHMMLLCTAVSFLLKTDGFTDVSDTSRIWDSNPYPSMIRLQGGSYSNQGRVEVYCNGQWGTICREGFSSNDANTICKQLGYSGYVRKNYQTL